VFRKGVQKNTCPENSRIIMYAAHWCRLIHGKVFDLGGTEYYVLVWLLNGRDEFCWRPKFMKKIISIQPNHRS